MRITLGVTGGVAAYKSAELVRRLQQEGHSVQVVMTRAAREFITPLTFAALSGQKVITDLFAGSAGGEANLESAIEHIAVAQRTDLLLVAPATADTLAKFARGIADDFLSTLYLASTAAGDRGASDERQHVAARGDAGEFCDAARSRRSHRGAWRGLSGLWYDGSRAFGRARRDPEGGAGSFASKARSGGRDVLVTAGPTCEDIDPVRFLTNRSSGKMGYAIAEAAARRGAEVMLVSGPTALESPEGVERVGVRSTEEMLRAVQKHFPASSIAIFAAAVADYRVAEPSATRLSVAGRLMTIRLEPNPDILATMARDKGDSLVVGFAAETDNVAENARKKLASKNADLIVANDVTAEGAGFDADTNIVTLFSRDGRDLPLPRMSKAEVAQRILDEAVRLRGVLRSKPASHRAGD